MCQVKIGTAKYAHPGCLFSRKYAHPHAHIYLNMGIWMPKFMVKMGMPL